MNIYLGDKVVRAKSVPIVNRATQGPCPDGFHVPLNDDWGTLISIKNTLGLSNYDMSVYLKMPLAGFRYAQDSNVSNQGNIGRYWSSTRSEEKKANCIYITSGEFYQSGAFRCQGYSIRPFKNSSVTPDSSWTTLYQGSGSAGIFHNSSSGLISMSGDGSTWITISDKNLGATTVYNNGDTLSESNCGYYYQWGNNYGFPRTGSVTTSTSQVDASAYGPGNYYSSSTFIALRSARWDSTDNGNLWGGEDGNVPV